MFQLNYIKQLDFENDCVFLTIFFSVIFQSNTGQIVPIICGLNTGQHSNVFF
jgi:hypothetical protein